MTDPFQILLINGSTREPSYTRTLTTKVQEALIERGAQTILWDLRNSPLPIANPEFHSDPEQHTNPKVRRFVVHASNADAFVLASPIYHNSYSGTLKNALDHLAIAQFYYKPVALLSHGGDAVRRQSITCGLLYAAYAEQPSQLRFAPDWRIIATMVRTVISWCRL